jgi:RNA polymerase sigma-70 factor (ECF subfamily)
MSVTVERKCPADGDAGLMDRVRADEPGAFAELVGRFRPAVFGHFLRQLGDHQEAEDLTQNVFLRLYRARRRWRPSARVSTWVYHVARNVLRNAFRSRRRRPAHLLSQLPGPDAESPAWLADEGDAPSRAVELAELGEVVRSAIGTLDGRQRAAVEMRVRDQSYGEIADALALTPQAAKSLLYRARTQLRESLRAYVD